MSRYTLLFTLFFLSNCGQKQSINRLSPKTSQDHCVEYAKMALQHRAVFGKDGIKIDDDLVNCSLVDWRILDSANNDDLAYSGVGYLDYDGCTASLIKTSGNDNRPAYLVTNGHCAINPPDPSKVIYKDQDALDIEANVSFFYYKKRIQAGTTLKFATDKVVFYSMLNTDIALIRLKSTNFQELTAKGVKSYELAARAASGTPIYNIAVPQSGVTDINLKIASCFLGDSVSLEEGDFSFNDSFRFTQCSIVGGSSGSPIFAKESNKIIGLVNTTANDADLYKDDCSLNKPCEVAADGSKKTSLGINYGQFIDLIAGCFNSEGFYDYKQTDCKITKKYPS